MPCLITLDATVTLASRRGERTLPVEEFITGYRKTALAPDEVIASIRIPFVAARPAVRRLQAVEALRPGHLDGGRRVPRRGRRRQGAQLRAAYGGMAARAMRAAKVEAALTGRPWMPAWIADIEHAARARLHADRRSSRRRRLPAARGRQPRAPVPARDHLDRADAGGGVMNAPLGTHPWRRAHARCATTAPSATSPAARSISTTCRTRPARSKPRWCSARTHMPASAASMSPARSRRRACRGASRRADIPGQERHRADPQRRAAAAGGRGRI